MGKFILGIVVALVAIFGGGYYIAEKGYINFQADQPASSMERHFAMAAVDASTDRHAPDRKNPLAANEENIVAGAQLYVNHCAGCHGVPSNAESQFGRSFNPPVPAFFKDAPDMPENQNFFIIQHGTRWTGMPAWGTTLTEPQIWEIVTFLSNIQKLPPAASKVFDVPTPGGVR
jgi:mono/diheme cytochrome c family protein